jgi:hypothetical protein
MHGKIALLRYFHWSINNALLYSLQQDCDGKVSVRFRTWSKNSFENDLILVFSANGPQLIAEAEADWIKKSVEKARLWKSALISKMPTPHVWLGPQGEIGITWKTPTVHREIVQTAEVTATVHFQDSQRLLKFDEIPAEMAKFAETAVPPPNASPVV